jgi:type 1 glutamine amidotransferase
MATILLLCVTSLLMGASAFAGASPATTPLPDEDRWLHYPGDANTSPGLGRRVVFLAGDEEYRSEESMPMLARMFAQHGFETVVLFSQDPETGEIDPENSSNIPGMHLIDDADLVVVNLRFRELPDKDMKHLVDHVEAGKPVSGLRTATHAFYYRENPDSAHADWTFNSTDPKGGFGGHILGETWVAHHGHHGSEATRGVIEPENADHPVLHGVKDVFGPTDVYTIRELPDDSTILLRGGILEGMDADDAFVKDDRNDPMHPVAWLRERRLPDGGTQRIFCTTMGTSQDFSSRDLRRLVLQASLWQLENERMIPGDGVDAPLVGHWAPTRFGFGTHRTGLTPAMVRDGHPKDDAKAETTSEE